MNKYGEPKNIERLGNVRIIDSNTGVAFVIEEDEKKKDENKLQVFIDKVNALQEEYGLTLDTIDPYIGIFIVDEEGNRYDMEGDPIE
jgi:hypothetical protein